MKRALLSAYVLLAALPFGCGSPARTAPADREPAAEQAPPPSAGKAAARTPEPEAAEDMPRRLPAMSWSSPSGYGPAGRWERIRITPQGDTVRREYPNIGDTAIEVDSATGRIALFEGNNRRDFVVGRILATDSLCIVEAQPEDPDDPDEGMQRFRCRHLGPGTALWSYAEADTPAAVPTEGLFTLRPGRYELQTVDWDEELDPAARIHPAAPEGAAQNF